MQIITLILENTEFFNDFYDKLLTEQNIDRALGYGTIIFISLSIAYIWFGGDSTPPSPDTIDISITMLKKTGNMSENGNSLEILENLKIIAREKKDL